MKLIYIMGVARSGSTLLNSILGCHPDIMAVGELENLPTQGWIENGLCSCGEKVDECEFWAGVKKSWKSVDNADVNISDYIQQQRKYTRLKSILFLFRKNISLSDQNFRNFLETSKRLFESILTCSGKTVLVDSSKNPARALALSFIPGIDFYLIHLVRDARGVIWSHKKAFQKDTSAGVQHEIKPRNALCTAIDWLIVNVVSELVFRYINKKCLFVRYEDFVNNPADGIEKIGMFADIDTSVLAPSLKKELVLDTEHIVAGNRLRMNRKIIIKPDTEWQRSLSFTDKTIFWLFDAILSVKYGYIK